jgi:hypothetical protein
MSKAIWACPICGEDFTRKTSAMRHSSNLHNGRGLPVRYIDYVTGRQTGQYPAALTPRRLSRRKNKTGDISRDGVLRAYDFETNGGFEHIAAPLTTTNTLRNPVIEAVHNFLDVEKIYRRLDHGMNINIAKPSWLRAFICDLCLSVPIEPVWNFVEEGSLTKVKHVCDPEVVLRVKPLIEDKRKALHHASLRCLAEVVNYWIGDSEAYLKAEEFLPTERYGIVKAADTPPSRGSYIILGDLKMNHWADRVVKEAKKTSTATGAVTINKDELMDFLSIAMATFGIFRIKMHEGGTRDFLMYIVRGLEFCKFNHLKVLEARNSNINDSNNTSHSNLYSAIQFVNAGPPGNRECAIFRFDKLYFGYQKDLRRIEDWHLKNLAVKSSNINTTERTDVHNVIQFVSGGAIFRLDKADSMSKKDLSLQIEEWSRNHARYHSYALSDRKDVSR